MVRRNIPANNIVASNGNNGSNGSTQGPSKQVVSQGNMIGKPTVAISERVETRVIQNLETDPYFSLKVSTAGATAAELVILFDASGGYQFGMNKANGANVVIEGLSVDYQYLLNDIAHNASYVDMLKMTVKKASGDCAQCDGLEQYARPIELYDSSKGSKPRLLKTIYPEQGVHEGQYQLAINTFQSDLILTNRTAFVYLQEPNTIITWGFYQVAELGRKQ